MTQWGEQAVPAHRFIGFDKSTGAAVWFSSTRPKPEDTTYSTPFLTVLNGQAAMVFGAGDGFMYAMQPRTGKIIWKYECSNRGINTPPLGRRRYGVLWSSRAKHGGHDESWGPFLQSTEILQDSGEIDEADLKWKIPEHSVEGSQPLLVDGRLYVIEDGGTLDIIDPETGEIIADKKVGRRPGSMVYGDGKIYCCDADRQLLDPRTDRRGRQGD